MPELARNGADGAIDPGLNPGAKTRDNPWDPVEINSASVFGTRVAEPILASGHVRPRKQAGHMIASDPIKTLYLNLQAGGRPHMGPGSPPDQSPGSAGMTINFDSVRTPNALASGTASLTLDRKHAAMARCGA